MKVPIIKNIHAKVLEAVSRKGALNMNNWHTCESTHCRAGWVIHLAGKMGYNLENKTCYSSAAQLIYQASSNIDVASYRFYASNKDAMADIKRCAELEMIIERGRIGSSFGAAFRKLRKGKL